MANSNLVVVQTIKHFVVLKISSVHCLLMTGCRGGGGGGG